MILKTNQSSSGEVKWLRFKWDKQEGLNGSEITPSIPVGMLGKK